MRFALLAAVLGIATVASGCHVASWHGVCDCQGEDQCTMRQPWLCNGSAAPLTPATGLPVPANASPIAPPSGPGGL